VDVSFLDFAQHVYDTTSGDGKAGLGILVLFGGLILCGTAVARVVAVCSHVEGCARHWRDVRLAACQVAVTLGKL
jgi:hypothetical protein